MASIDIFHGDAFGLIEISGALERIPHKPGLLGQLGIFVPRPIRTEVFGIESKDGILSVIPTSPRGAPLPQAHAGGRAMRHFSTVRLAQGDRLMASELQGIRAFGSENEFQTVGAEVMSRMTTLRDNLELTLERHRLGAVQGIVLDADGNQLYDWFQEWGLGTPSAVEFNFDDEDADIRGAIRNIKRRAMRGAHGAWTPSTSLVALAGDTFYDRLVNHAQIKETRLGNERAPLLEGIDAFSSIELEGVTFVNYRGTDDETTLAIPTDEARFFPRGGDRIFQHVMSPGESLDLVNTPGRPFYAMTVPDRDRNSWVDLEVYSYPAMVCTRPETLVTGRIKSG